MRAIINGKLYDTDTAALIESYSYGDSGDFSHFSEELYQKETGEFFLYGEGGPRSRYAKVCGDHSWCGSEKIIPECDFDVKEWVENHCDADTYIDLFGAVEE